MKTKIMSIGDVHGTSTWKSHIFGSINAYKVWKSNKGEIPPFNSINPEGVDKIVFVGDYVDSFTKSDKQILNNLKEIILFKIVYPDNVVLLLGNHDFHYIMDGFYYSGYRESMKADLQNLYNKYMDCFQLAYEFTSEIDDESVKTIWTHAGITSGWIKELGLTHSINPDKLADSINSAWEKRGVLKHVIGAVDRVSGGWDPYAGPIWVRPYQLLEDAVLGYDQIVGHTPQRDIDTKLSNKCINGLRVDEITFIDVLERGSDRVLIKTY
jgi:hypothetical protein